jgi:hypothetical protein
VRAPGARHELDPRRRERRAGDGRRTDARIPIDRVQAIWKIAYELSGDPDLALHAIEVLPFGAYRVLDYLIACVPSVGAGLAKVSDYFPLINNVVRLPYAVGEREVTFAVHAPSYPSMITRPSAEYTLAACYLHTRIATICWTMSARGRRETAWRSATSPSRRSPTSSGSPHRVRSRTRSSAGAA